MDAIYQLHQQFISKRKESMPQELLSKAEERIKSFTHLQGEIMAEFKEIARLIELVKTKITVNLYRE